LLTHDESIVSLGYSRQASTNRSLAVAALFAYGFGSALVRNAGSGELMRNSPILMPCLIVLVGPPGSGKTTWAQRNGRGAVHVSQDGLIDAITPHGFEHEYRAIYRDAEDAVARAALRAGHAVIVDRTNRTRAHRARWVGLARAAGRPVVAVVISTPHALCRERNARRGPNSRLSEDRMDRMFAALEPVEREEGFEAIYDEGATLEEILAEIHKAAAEKLEAIA
jgi:predicted kinase